MMEVEPEVPFTISIHASAKEATRLGFKRISQYNISIHASAKEATFMIDTSIPTSVFQSTPPRRRRPVMAVVKVKQQHNFNPRLREGGDVSNCDS